MSYVMVDVETDGDIPGDFSMISLGAVIVRPDLADTFYGELHPISDKWDDEALKVSNHSREETLGYDDPTRVLLKFETWLFYHSVGKKPMFISDNNGFDFMFVCWYFRHFLGRNPFGHSSTIRKFFRIDNISYVVGDGLAYQGACPSLLAGLQGTDQILAERMSFTESDVTPLGFTLPATRGQFITITTTNLSDLHHNFQAALVGDVETDVIDSSLKEGVSAQDTR
jgi:hypothetical protein